LEYSGSRLLKIALIFGQHLVNVLFCLQHDRGRSTRWTRKRARKSHRWLHITWRPLITFTATQSSTDAPSIATYALRWVHKRPSTHTHAQRGSQADK